MVFCLLLDVFHDSVGTGPISLESKRRKEALKGLSIHHLFDPYGMVSVPLTSRFF
jgi:hypothetical protein